MVGNTDVMKNALPTHSLLYSTLLAAKNKIKTHHECYSLIDLFNKYPLSIYYVSRTVLGALGTTMNNNNKKILDLTELIF